MEQLIVSFAIAALSLTLVAASAFWIFRRPRHTSP